MKFEPELRAVLSQFEIPGELVQLGPLGAGHINDTYLARFSDRGREARFVLQRINHYVFKEPVCVMENIARVTGHVRAKLAGEPDLERRVLQFVPARNGSFYWRDDTAGYWRACRFIEHSQSLDAFPSPAQAFEAAKAFGHFQSLLADLPAPPLHETIPDFHHTPKRFDHFQRALAADPANRACLAKPEIDFATRRHAIVSTLVDAGLPPRITHNDTKLNNVLFDAASAEALCIIDLDTVMPGFAPGDFGDLVRSAANAAKEDERDLSRVAMRFEIFEALARGYLAAAGGFLAPAEKQLLPFSARLISFETGLRFLTDFLEGDLYFRISRPEQNLDRCRAHFKLVDSIEQQQDRLERLVQSL